MTQEQEQMIDKLCESILRENGHGFCMSIWCEKRDPGYHLYGEGIVRIVPPCGTVACIGGTLAVLTGQDPAEAPDSDLGQLIGLTLEETEALFYHFYDDSPKWDDGLSPKWPREFVLAYDRAKTPLGRAKVVVELLQRIKSDGSGRCLFGKDESHEQHSETEGS